MRVVPCPLRVCALPMHGAATRLDRTTPRSMTAPILSPTRLSMRPPDERGAPGVARPESHRRPNAWLATIGIWAVAGLVALAIRHWPGMDAGAGAQSRVLYQLVHVLTFATYGLHFLAYFAIFAIAHAIDFLGWRRDQRVEEARLAERSARLETQLARAEIDILRSQLDPHFLFNALHVISELVHVNPARADRMVARLGDLLRMSAALARSGDVALRKELEFVNAYLEIQQARFGGRVRVGRGVETPALGAPGP